MTLTDDTPITLKDACEIYFNDKIGVHALKAEYARKQLEMWKVGRTWFTTISKLKDMETRKCQDEVPALNSGLTKRVSDGRSATAKASAAQAAVAMRLEQQKKN